MFVDFDNIYLGRRQLDQATAHRFPRAPAEFIVLSADADFTPVLRKLRR